MICFSNYIGLDNLTPSRSGIYADSLPGIDIEMIDGLRKNAKDSDETWQLLYDRAWQYLLTELTGELQDKFYVDHKIVSRETSQFKTDINFNLGLSGVTIEFNLPRYAVLNIVSIQLSSDQAYSSPEGVISIYQDDANGELLHEVSTEITEGKNTIYIDQTFEADKIFVAFNPEIYALKETENRKYNFPYVYWSCDTCTFDCGGYHGKVTQVNGGGLNVVYNITCSIEKFLCQNINLFTQAFLYAIGMEITKERRFGERLNRFTTMTLERAEELMMFYTETFEKHLRRSVQSQSIREDKYCFSCKHIVTSKSSTP